MIRVYDPFSFLTKSTAHQVGATPVPEIAQKFYRLHDSDIENPKDPVRLFFEAFQKTKEGTEFFRMLKDLTNGIFNNYSIEDQQKYIHEVINAAGEPAFEESRALLADASLDYAERLLTENKTNEARDFLDLFLDLEVVANDKRLAKIYKSLAQDDSGAAEAA